MNTQQLFDRLIGIREPADTSVCAICRGPQTTGQVFGLLDIDTDKHAATESEFCLCRTCVQTFYTVARALNLIGIADQKSAQQHLSPIP